MNRARSLFVFAFVCAVAVGLTGCGDPREKAVESLAEMRYSFSVDDYLLAAEAGDVAAIRLFHEAGQAVDAADEAGNTALMRAAAVGRLEVVEQLLDAGADAGAANEKGRTALMLAAESGREDVARKLLANGADLAVKDGEGWTALKLAAFGGRAGVVEWLSGKVDQETLDQVLLVASFTGDPAVIDQLLNHGAYINFRSPEALTPLMIAAQEGHLDAVKLLLQSQANPYALDDDEHTAANLADAGGHIEVRDLLLDPSSVFAMVGSGGEPGEAGRAMEESITRVLDALSGGEGAPPPADLVVAAPERAVTGSMPIRHHDGHRLTSIQGRFIGSEPGPGAAFAAESDPGGGPVASRGKAGAARAARGVESLRMRGYRETPLPVMLKGVERDASVARVRVLSSRDATPVAVKEGQIIPGTHLRVASLDSKFISSKMGKGALVDVSTIMIEDTVSGAKHLLVKDVPGRSSEIYATLTLSGGAYDYVAKTGDVFRARTESDGEQEFEILGVRPTQVVIRNVATGEVVTVNRDGIAMR